MPNFPTKVHAPEAVKPAPRKMAITLTLTEYMAKALADDTLKELLGDEALKTVKAMLADDEKRKAYEKAENAKQQLREAYEEAARIAAEHRDD